MSSTEPVSEQFETDSPQVATTRGSGCLTASSSDWEEANVPPS